MERVKASRSISNLCYYLDNYRKLFSKWLKMEKIYSRPWMWFCYRGLQCVKCQERIIASKIEINIWFLLKCTFKSMHICLEGLCVCFYTIYFFVRASLLSLLYCHVLITLESKLTFLFSMYKLKSPFKHTWLCPHKLLFRNFTFNTCMYRNIIYDC